MPSRRNETANDLDRRTFAKVRLSLRNANATRVGLKEVCISQVPNMSQSFRFSVCVPTMYAPYGICWRTFFFTFLSIAPPRRRTARCLIKSCADDASGAPSPHVDSSIRFITCIAFRVIILLGSPVRSRANGVGASFGVRVDRVEIPPAIRPPLLAETIECETQSRVLPIPQRGHEIEAHEEIVVVMDRVVESVPWWLLSSLLVQFLAKIVLGPKLDGALHALRPLRRRIHREGTHALPRVQVPTAPETTPAATLVPIRHQPLERAADRGMVCVTELHQGARGVPGRAQVSFLGTFHRESSIRPGESFNPEIARLLDPRICSGQAKVREDEEHPVRGEILRPVQALSAHPPSRRVLLREDLLSPPFLREHVLRGHDLGIVGWPFEQLGEGEIADGRLVHLEEPVQRALRVHLGSTPPGPARSRSSGRGLARKQ